MPSLSQLLADHKNVLILDAASTQTQVGLMRLSATAFWQRTPDEAGRGMFEGSERILSESGLRLEDIGAFVFCEGPGSMLGVRTVAMALRTWVTLNSRAVFSYQSLAIAARATWHEGEKRKFAVVADARRDTWHLQQINVEGQLAPLQRVPATGLPEGELFTPENFRSWATPPRSIGVCGYDLAQLFETLKDDDDLFRATAAPDAFQHEAPEYKKWPAAIHSIETVAKK
jgi:tRNA threonylcarbamoyladenosine biosynthesis protein TsaB